MRPQAFLDIQWLDHWNTEELPYMFVVLKWRYGSADCTVYCSSPRYCWELTHIHWHSRQLVGVLTLLHNDRGTWSSIHVVVKKIQLGLFGNRLLHKLNAEEIITLPHNSRTDLVRAQVLYRSLQVMKSSMEMPILCPMTHTCFSPPTGLSPECEHLPTKWTTVMF